MMVLDSVADVSCQTSTSDRTMFRSDRYVTPLYRLAGQAPEAGGTGTWLQVGDEKFLVTAAHVIDNNFIWFPRKQGLKRLNSPYVITNPTTESRAGDRGDFAVFHLVREDVEAMHPFHEFIQMSDVEVNLNYKYRDKYEFIGYPWRREDLNRGARQTTPGFTSITSESVSEKTFSILKLSIHSHVVIAFNRKKMIRDGSRIMAPLPHGMSGGAVWRLYSDSEARKLAAIGIEYNHHYHCLVGTRISAVLEYIRVCFPQLSPFIPKTEDAEIVATKNGAGKGEGAIVDRMTDLS